MKSWLGETFNALQYVLAAVQQNETLQIIEFVFSAVTSAVIIAFRIWRWIKDAKADGKITKEELEEGAKIIAEGAEEISEKIKKGKDKEDNG